MLVLLILCNSFVLKVTLDSGFRVRIMALRLEKSLHFDGIIIAYKIRIMENQTGINMWGYIVEIIKRKT